MTQSVSLKDKKQAPAAPAAPASMNVMALVGAVVIATGAATGVTLFVMKRSQHASATHEAAAHSEHAPAVVAPGYTLSLEPFLVMATDERHMFHAMRVTLAVEFQSGATEDTVRPFAPRVRDAALTQLRSTPYEVAVNPAQMDHLREELQNRFQATGAPRIARVLITDLVVQ